jgi:DNA invertase Pin-like site-specific DNA recombinase
MNMKVFYSRISTNDGSQKHDRQLQDLKGFDYVLTDNFTGNSDLFDRPKGQQIKKLIDEQLLTHLEIHSIDRLGRNLISVLSTWKELTEKGVTIVCRNPNIRNFDDNGNPDKFSELLLSILGSMYSFERSMLLQRQKEGIAIARIKNPQAYCGRRINTQDTPERYIKKSKSIAILNYLSKGTHSYTEIAKILNCSPVTITKTKKIAKELGVL